MSVLFSIHRMSLWTHTVLVLWCCGYTVAESQFPWMTNLGPRPEDLPKSMPNLNDTLAEIARQIEARQTPRLISRRYSRIVVSRGASVTLNCTVENAGNVTVTWVRGTEALTVNKLRYTNDERLIPQHEPESQDHSLCLSHVQPDDSANYDCRVGTEPEQVARIKLIVIDAYSVIFGASEVHVAEGGRLYLLCMVLEVSDIPEYILWYHNTTIIDYSQSRISVTMEEATSSSELQVHVMHFSDSGNYTCHPSNASPAFAIVNVFKDTNRKKGPAQKCDDCVLFIQLGATFAFFTLSFVVAFCCHGHHHQLVQPWRHHSLSEDSYIPPEAVKIL